MQIEKLKHKTIIVRVNAQHSFSSDYSNTVGEVPDYMIQVNDVDAEGFLISKNARVMLTRNINAEQGLVNGAMGIVTEIIFQGGIPSVVFLKFDDPMVVKHGAMDKILYIHQYISALLKVNFYIMGVVLSEHNFL